MNFILICLDEILMVLACLPVLNKNEKRIIKA
jgi:hypothetical protein